MLSCLYGAIRACLIQSVGTQHPLLQGKILTQMVCWVALRSLDYDSISGTEAYNRRLHGQLGNKIGAIFLPLLLHIEDPLNRVHHVQEITKKLKQSAEPIASWGILTIVGYLPPPLAKFIFETAGFKATASFSNFPGPRKLLYFMDSAVNEIVVATRPQHTLGYFFLLFSYNGRVQVAMSRDSKLAINHEELFDAFQSELSTLEALTRIQT